MKKRQYSKTDSQRCNIPYTDTPPNLHEKVLALLAKEPRGKILDIGCGGGALAYQLDKMGFRVYASDITQGLKLPNISWTYWDLNSKTIPYDNDFFDYVVCVEVIEHLENPHDLIRKFRNILKNGGKLIITMPNILNISSRIQFAKCGWFNFFSKTTLKHINPIPFWELDRILIKNGFIIEEIQARGFSKLSKILRILTLDYFFTPRNKFILEGSNLIVKAKKWIN